MSSAVEPATRPLLSLEGAKLESEPYPHFFLPRAIEPAFAETLISWFEKDAPWEVYHEKDFYDALVVNLRKVPLPDPVAALLDRRLGAALAADMQRIFGTAFDDHIDFDAHKLVPGYRIRVHNDTGMEYSHRIVLHLTRTWTPEQGGILVVLRDTDCERFRPGDCVYPPIPGSAWGFGISPRSHHAVTELLQGERYTVVLSFRPPGALPQA